jgi:hypothetical protein
VKTDNGGEFRGKEFEQFCKQCGTTRQNTTPYTPQQNGVYERMNITLMDKARSMLSGAGLAQEFWAEAIDIAKYLVNMSPSSTLVDSTPHEVWSGNKPSLSHLKVFGYDAFVHVPKEKRSKLDKKVVKCIFIGYKEGMKGYKLWDPASRKIVYSRDVVFRDVGRKSESEVVQTKNNPEKVRFELRNEEEGDSNESIESDEEVEQPTLVVKRSERVRKLVERYSLPDFRSAFVLTTTDEEPKSVKEVVDSTEGRLWNSAMVEEMESLHKNEKKKKSTWGPGRRNLHETTQRICSKGQERFGVQIEKFPLWSKAITKDVVSKVRHIHP